MARVLCLHGLGGTADTMAPLVEHLVADGHTVTAPTLPGHGTDPADLIATSWTTWLDAARSADPHPDLIVGQSMGATLAFALAAEGRSTSVVAINPLAADPDATDGLEWRQSRGTAWIEVGPSSVAERAYERLPVEALLAMHEGVASVDLAAVVVPVLIVTSRLDDVVDPANSDLVAGALGGAVDRLALGRSGHVATLDVERTDLAVAVADRARAVWRATM
ncbi:MAG: alpha/beta hydrolase [Ilumatobacteraceae bacterium]